MERYFKSLAKDGAWWYFNCPVLIMYFYYNTLAINMKTKRRDKCGQQKNFS